MHGFQPHAGLVARARHPRDPVRQKCCGLGVDAAARRNIQGQVQGFRHTYLGADQNVHRQDQSRGFTGLDQPNGQGIDDFLGIAEILNPEGFEPAWRRICQIDRCNIPGPVP